MAVSVAFRYRGGELLSLRGEHRRAGGREDDGHGWIQRDSGDRFAAPSAVSAMIVTSCCESMVAGAVYRPVLYTGRIGPTK